VTEPISTAQCPHEKWRATKRTTGNGTGPWFQCLDCGSARALKKADYPNFADLPDFDDDLTKRIWEERDRDWQLEREKRAEAERQRSITWWERYNEYLQTEAWRERRAKVLRRARGVCEACLEHPATEVHHTTYKHLGCEPLFELRAVCRDCHEEITRMDRERREGLAAE
jgi:5-methylcytosine-specific restriction endonuclease McrA